VLFTGSLRRLSEGRTLPTRTVRVTASAPPRKAAVVAYLSGPSRKELKSRLERLPRSSSRLGRPSPPTASWPGVSATPSRCLLTCGNADPGKAGLVPDSGRTERYSALSHIGNAGRERRTKCLRPITARQPARSRPTPPTCSYCFRTGLDTCEPRTFSQAPSTPTPGWAATCWPVPLRRHGPQPPLGGDRQVRRVEPGGGGPHRRGQRLVVDAPILLTCRTCAC